MLFKEYTLSFTVSTALLLATLLPLTLGICLPCQSAFRRPDGTWQKMLHARESTSGSGNDARPSIHIMNPSYRSVWFNGELQLVTWNTTDVASLRVGSSDCQVYLGQWDWNAKDYKKIYFDSPLAMNCNLHDGNTTIRVPKDEKFKPSNNWVVILFNRNADDHSSPFTIAAPPKEGSV